jgi:hypothetical protein
MITIEVSVTPKATLSRAEKMIEEYCASEGLSIAMKGTLSTYPGCIHWHFRKEGQRGTLEITLRSERRKIWFSVHAGRNGPWIEASVRRLKTKIEKKLKG